MTVLDRTSQAIDSVPVTPSDTNPIVDSNNRQRISDYISVGVTGNVQYLPAGVSEQGAVSTLAAGLAAGVMHKIRASKIFATGTTATGITAYFS